jgi:hypothetical protein
MQLIEERDCPAPPLSLNGFLGFTTMARKSIARTSGVSEMNIIPPAVSAMQVTAFESMQPEWLDENYYDISTLLLAVCCRMASKRVNPHDHAEALVAFREEVCNLSPAHTIRGHIAGKTIIVYHRDQVNSLPYELVMY